MKQRPSITVVVVSFQVRDLLRRCLASVRAQQGVEAETWVVDNASSDGSAEMVEAEFPEVRLVRNADNVGFARANNQALAQGRGRWRVLLNPDTELPPHALAEIVRVFERHPSAGAVGLALRNPDGTGQPSCHAFPGLWNQIWEALGLQRLALVLGRGTVSAARLPRRGEGEVDWVAGACLAMSEAAWQRVGGLEETRFLYGEEMDWCWRARRQGFSTVWSRAACVLHHGGASGADRLGPLFAMNLESRIAFMRRHRGAWRAGLTRAILLAGCVVRLLYWRLRTAAERRSGVRPRTREQLERFSAGLAALARRRP